jgi:hypothetical protein
LISASATFTWCDPPGSPSCQALAVVAGRLTSCSSTAPACGMPTLIGAQHRGVDNDPQNLSTANVFSPGGYRRQCEQCTCAVGHRVHSGHPATAAPLSAVSARISLTLRSHVEARCDHHAGELRAAAGGFALRASPPRRAGRCPATPGAPWVAAATSGPTRSPRILGALCPTPTRHRTGWPRAGQGAGPSPRWTVRDHVRDGGQVHAGSPFRNSLPAVTDQSSAAVASQRCRRGAGRPAPALWVARTAATATPAPQPRRCSILMQENGSGLDKRAHGPDFLSSPQVISGDGARGRQGGER